MSALATRSVRKQLSFAGVGTNVLGAVLVTAFGLYLTPTTLTHQETDDLQALAIPAIALYVVVSFAIGGWLIWWRPLRSIVSWLAVDRPPTPRERDEVLRYPRRWAMGTFVVWLIAAALLTALAASISTHAVPAALWPTLLAGAMACAMQYLIVERIMRPITALALADGRPPTFAAPGVGIRLVAFWALGTAVPLLGIAIITALDLLGVDYDRLQVVQATLFLAVAGLAIGFVSTQFSARSIAEPVGSLRAAQERIADGDFETRVQVDDGSEIGLLQAGFNHMATGLAEREKLRAAFGAYVDPGLTERVLREGTDLEGEEVDVSLLFADIRGFTAFAETADAHEVVARLNALFGQIVPIVLRHGGHANKFIGDGLLAVFGAPDRLADHARCAVAAGLEIVAAVQRGGGGLRVGVGVNSGPVIAGTIGGGGRLDFTVIGDTVNTAARVETATRKTGDDLLITHSTWSLLDDDAWIERDAVPLKGKAVPVRIYAPRPTR
ncbi:adenylate/guanylate cyclase domain-containing protein [Antrihabitans sp. YC2-6]|uniref:adenylate/guanylate cyclase domain-containing protein n=1 Tax=Antrihabitans sp. YC2-6 TaxID=2799498 RepID=UPI0018F3FDD7|nr:adenylate/guanylate cyclase domain-containing protein [Antrihabitans sp. YC2-6]MBJ8348899.1 HAMP domain-containing protein [Antrihabitans sp. YC2-6]